MEKKLRKDWTSLMNLIEVMFDLGYSVTMANHKRWSIHCNGNWVFNEIPQYEKEIRGNKTRDEATNLDVLHELLSDFIEWYKQTITSTPICWITKKEIDILSLDIFE